jgi:hypothetical protein
MVSESLKKVDSSVLLWKSLVRQPEFQAGALRLNQDITIRTFKNQKGRYLESERFDFIIAMKELLKPIATLDNEKVEYLIFRIYECYQKEMAYAAGLDSRFSIDIVFQFIEFLCADGKNDDIEKILQKETSLNKKEVESIIAHIKAFNKLGAYFNRSNSLKKTIENGEQILSAIASSFPDITWLALESMFYLLIAQYALATKYSCESLLRGWMNDYGFDENQYVVVANFFPPGTSLLDFRGNYTNAIRSLHGMSAGMRPEYDLLLLRSIGNYFSSWIVRVAHQMEADLQMA